MIHTEDPVNSNRYTIYAMIPGLDSYVATKIDKKKLATIYTIIFMAAILATTWLLCITCQLILN